MSSGPTHLTLTPCHGESNTRVCLIHMMWVTWGPTCAGDPAIPPSWVHPRPGVYLRVYSMLRNGASGPDIGYRENTEIGPPAKIRPGRPIYGPAVLRNREYPRTRVARPGRPRTGDAQDPGSPGFGAYLGSKVAKDTRRALAATLPFERFFSRGSQIETSGTGLGRAKARARGLNVRAP